MKNRSAATRKLPSSLAFACESMAGRLLPSSLLRASGLTKPKLSKPFVLLLRPFRSSRRDLFSHFWVGACVWQFGQAIYPVDRYTGLFSGRPEYFIPNQPAWKRTTFGFDRVLHQDQWLSEIVNLAADAMLIVADTTHISENVLVELRALEGRNVLRKTLSIHDCANPHLRNIDPHEMGPDLVDLLSASIPYDYSMEAGLVSFWARLASECARLTCLSDEEIMHKLPPDRLYIYKKKLLQVFADGCI